MTQRIVRLFAKCQVEMLILDEIQHFVDRQNNKLLYRVSDWLKTLLKETRVACVLVGLPYANQLVVSNEQFCEIDWWTLDVAYFSVGEARTNRPVLSTPVRV